MVTLHAGTLTPITSFGNFSLFSPNSLSQASSDLPHVLTLFFSFFFYTDQVSKTRKQVNCGEKIVNLSTCDHTPLAVGSKPAQTIHTPQHDQVSNFIRWYCAEGARRRQSFSVSSQNNSGARPADHCKIVQLLPRQK